MFQDKTASVTWSGYDGEQEAPRPRPGCCGHRSLPGIRGGVWGDALAVELIFRKRNILYSQLSALHQPTAVKVLLHCLGLGVNWVVTGSPWDPWTPLWRALLHLAGNPTNYTLWVYGKLSCRLHA